MLTPEQNPIGYKNSSCLDIPQNITQTKSKLILIHGTADDNVHSLNTFQFIKKLIKSEITFDSMFYPDETHSLIRSSKHLLKSIVEKLSQGINER